MRMDVLTVGIVQTRCYILSPDNARDCLIIDPGAEAALIRRTAGNRKIAAILLTHGHFDHIGAIRDIISSESAENPKIIVHSLDAPMLGDPMLNASMALLRRPVTAPEPTDSVKEGDELQIAGLTVKVLHTPGHTPGSVCYEIEGELFTGDTLFEYGWGRTDLPGGSGAQMEASLRRLMPLASRYTIRPGH